MNGVRSFVMFHHLWLQSASRLSVALIWLLILESDVDSDDCFNWKAQNMRTSIIAMTREMLTVGTVQRLSEGGAREKLVRFTFLRNFSKWGAYNSSSKSAEKSNKDGSKAVALEFTIKNIFVLKRLRTQNLSLKRNQNEILLTAANHPNCVLFSFLFLESRLSWSPFVGTARQ